MSYEIEFDLIDTDTGEILTKNKRVSITTEYSYYPHIFALWLACFYRGLRQGRNLSFRLNASRFRAPEQLNIF